MSEHIYKGHNKSLILYHFVCPVKYRRTVFTSDISKTFKEVCLQIELRYDVQFLIQSVPTNSPKKTISAIRSITAKEIFRLHPEVKRFLWGGKFWTSGYSVNTVGQYANEEVIRKYLQNQGNSDYEKLHSDLLRLF
ncbi:IS200/IS605 family transposase [Polaribacter filamentus]|jgi:putative transposase|uniref:IS200/IS605 family transposase n=1 Tax=Polaribacter filamentus TaxID=53483 RepID=A0A2S7KKC0_9FLAO|nr:IS200/IS605 family transposase [Polaribacter filamentus]PQB03055.1 IS200/IS605 family transposase [Polaribacter filamentus]